MKLALRARFLLLGSCVLLTVASSAVAEPERVTLWVDDDDDDGNGLADRVDQSLAPRGVDERGELSGKLFELGADPSRAAAGHLRLFYGERAIGGAVVRRTSTNTSPISLQASGVGEWPFRVDARPRVAIALRAYRVASGKWVAPAYAAVSRERPGGWGEGSDPEAFSLGVRAPKGLLPKQVWLRSYSAKHRQVDIRGPLELSGVACPTMDGDTECGVSQALRLVTTSVDRAHPEAGLALRVELGGHVELDLSEHRAPRTAPAELHVIGPAPATAPARLGEVRLRVHVLRQGSAGSPAIGGSDEGAKRVMQRELRDSAALWSQCGLEFKLERLEVVDPPVTSMLSVGCEQGAQSSGGGLELNVGTKTLKLRWPAGLGPRQVAEKIRGAIIRLGFDVELSDNGSTGYTNLPTLDLEVRERRGSKLGAPVGLFALEEGSEKRPISDDATLPLCLGEVSLRDGLDHFNDFNASSGTVEERSLIKALQDDDPGTIELFVVPSFVNSGRIGESFIYTAGASVRNVLIVDRAGIRAGSRSFVLAHELGHVLLDMPGHPDDFGVDDPGRLMDSDASESSVFGPRRLSLDDCRRVWSQSGSSAPLPLITEVPTGLPKQLVVEPAVK
ncbi:MAG: ImmA/IrrE family metallo-endopeptidase [Polyangiaceae bacterium]